MAKNILSLMNVTEILSVNIDGLRTKEWDNFFVVNKIDDAMDDGI